MILFAQSSFTPPGGILGWLGCLAFILWITRLAVGLVNDLKGKPHPGEVQRESAEKFVHKAEFSTHLSNNTREHENLFSKIGGVERGARIELERRVQEIQTERAKSLDNLNRRNERIMFALGKIASKLNVDLDPTE